MNESCSLGWSQSGEGRDGPRMEKESFNYEIQKGVPVCKREG